jgi:hypothetical protein
MTQNLARPAQAGDRDVVGQLSEGTDLYESCEAVFAWHAADLQRFDIDHGYLSCTVGGTAVLLEPVFYWPDERLAFHERVLEAGYLAKPPRFDANPATLALLDALKRQLDPQGLMNPGALGFPA